MKPEFAPVYREDENKLYLQLHLPEGCEEVEAFQCSDYHDLPVPDALIEVEAAKLLCGIHAFSQYRDCLDGIRIPITLNSEGFDGKVCLEGLQLFHHPNPEAVGTQVEFDNSHTCTSYWLDVCSFWPVATSELADYLQELLIRYGLWQSVAERLHTQA